MSVDHERVSTYKFTDLQGQPARPPITVSVQEKKKTKRKATKVMPEVSPVVVSDDDDDDDDDDVIPETPPPKKTMVS